MSGSFGPAPISPFPSANALLDIERLNQSQSPVAQQNRLLDLQTKQQAVGSAELETMSRAAAAIEALEPAARPAAYQAAVRDLQRYGFAKNAPAEYPGDAVISRFAAMGMTAEKQLALRGARDTPDIYGIGGGGQPGAAPGAAASPGSAGPAVPIPARGTGGPGATAAVPTEWLPYFYEASRETGIPVELLIAQARQESSFNPNARGAAGEIGLFQIKPSTAQSPGFGVTGVDPATLTDPRQNILFGARYLRGRMGQGDPNNPADQARALTAYNGGGDPNYVANVNRYRPGQSSTDPGRAVTTYTPGGPGGGVVARNPGAVNVAGPGAPTAPSVAAPVTVEPETGVPVVASPAAPPAAPAPVAAPAPAVATPAQPAAAAMPPELQTDAQRLTPEDRRQLAPLFARVKSGQIPYETYQNEVQQRQAFNVARQEKWQTQQKAAADTAYQRQRDADADASRRKADVIRDQQEARAQQKAADEQAAAGKPYQGTAIEAQDDNILLGGDDGSAKYAGAYSRKAKPIDRPDGSSITPNMTAYDKPTYRGGKGQVAEGGAPDYGPSKVTPPTVMNVEQAKSAAYADRMAQSNEVMNPLDSAAMDWAQRTKGKVGDFVGYNISSPEYQRVKIAQENFITAKLRDESGASIGTPEFERDRVTFFPQPGDDAATIELKRRFRQTTIEGMQRQAGPAYKPPAASGSTGATVPARTPPPPPGFKVIQ